MKLLVPIILSLFLAKGCLFAKAPNILMVMGDDMTWSDCEPYGSTQVRTPNMARLAAEGLCLDGMFTSTAMCAPTRQQLYTGLYPVRNGAYPNHSHVHHGVKSIPHHLSALGYRVGLIGKTHFGPQKSFPFEILSRRSTDVDKIRKFVNRDSDQPYCLVVCSNSPHKPWTEGDASLYPPGKIHVPPYLIDSPETKKSLSLYFAEVSALDDELGRCMKLVDDSGQADNTVLIFTSEQGMQLPFGGKWSCYDTGLKTAFIVRWPKRIKAGSRNAALVQYVDVVPTLIEAAGGKPAELDAGRADAGGEKRFDGRSFLSVLTGDRGMHRDYVYGVHTTKGIIHGSLYPIRSVRSKRYKYIQNLNHTAKFNNLYTKSETATGRSYESGFVPLEKAAAADEGIAARLALFQQRPAEEIYDLKNDPYELKNLAADPALSEIKTELRKELESWMKQQGDQGMATERAGRRGNKAKPKPADNKVR